MSNAISSRRFPDYKEARFRRQKFEACRAKRDADRDRPSRASLVDLLREAAAHTAALGRRGLWMWDEA
jgi:hypothetical protein